MLEQSTEPVTLSTQLSAPPMTAGLPLIGSLLHVVRKQCDFFVEAREQHGNIYTADLGLLKMVILNDPAYIQHMLVEHAENYPKSGPIWKVISSITGQGLPSSEGEYWLRHRRMMQPQFHRKHIAAMGDLMVEATDSALSTWDAAAASGAAFNVVPGFGHIMMQVILRTLFSSGITQAETAKVGAEVKYAIQYMIQDVLYQRLPAWMPVPGRKRYQAAGQAVKDFIQEVIQRRYTTSYATSDFLDLLMAMTDDDGSLLTPSELGDEIMGMLLAGYETTSLGISWTLHFLLENPEILAKAQAEVDTALGDRTPTAADTANLPYLKMIIQEALRLRPPSWWIPRMAVKDDEIGGYKIKAGTTVVAMAYVVQQNPEVWPDPLTFDPERFNSERSKTQPHLAWMAFGAGRRLCIGRDFAMLELQLVLARLLQRYNFKPVPGRTVRPQLSTSLRPKGGVWTYLERRST